MIDLLDNVNKPSNFQKGNLDDSMESHAAGSCEKSQIKIDVRAQMPRFDNKDSSYTIVRFFRGSLLFLITFLLNAIRHPESELVLDAISGFILHASAILVPTCL